jgi:hypothetical protein
MYLPTYKLLLFWLAGVTFLVVILLVSRKEDRGFESPTGCVFLCIQNLQCCWSKRG